MKKSNSSRTREFPREPYVQRRKVSKRKFRGKTNRRYAKRTQRTVKSKEQLLIYRRFLEPLAKALVISQKDGDWSVPARLELVFGTEARRVEVVEAVEGFMLPPRRWPETWVPAGMVTSVVAFNREVLPGHELVLRADFRDAPSFEAEWNGFVFVLTEPEFRSIYRKVKRIW